MSAPSRTAKAWQIRHMKQYLAELSTLTGRSIQADELYSLEQTDAMRQDAVERSVEPRSAKCEIGFSDLNSERFRAFLQHLSDANPASIVVWVKHSKDCGALAMASLAEIKFDFDFPVGMLEVVVFVTSDFADRMLLDFSITPSGEQVVTVETYGTNWSSGVY